MDGRGGSSIAVSSALKLYWVSVSLWMMGKIAKLFDSRVPFLLFPFTFDCSHNVSKVPERLTSTLNTRQIERNPSKPFLADSHLP